MAFACAASAQASVHRTWITQYHVNGRKPRVTHGVVEKLTPAEAFEASRKVLARAALGGDPQGENAKRRAATRPFGAVVGMYLEGLEQALKVDPIVRAPTA